MNDLATLSPDWLQGVLESAWFDRYTRRADNYRLPTARREREALVRQVGQDSWTLLKALAEPTSPEAVRQSAHVALLRKIWDQPYGVRQKTIHWRKAQDLPANAGLLVSPEDPQVRGSKKRDEYWVGYKVHVSETCHDDAPHLSPMLKPRQRPPRMTKHLLPAQHLVDAGYTNSFCLADSPSQFGAELIGKASVENSWQARTPQAFPLAAFTIDFAQKRMTCPLGQPSNSWVEATDGRGQPIIHAAFPRSICLYCPLRSQCTHSAARGRAVAFRPQGQHEALQAARQRQETQTFKDIYAKRAGVEGKLSQAI